MARTDHLGYGTGPFTPDELETIRAEIERNRNHLDEIDGVALPAVAADFQRHLAETETGSLQQAASD